MKAQHAFTRCESQVAGPGLAERQILPRSLARDYTFEVCIKAVVRVRAQSERLAREVATSALGSPGVAEIRLANEGNFILGRKATIIDVAFLVEGDH